MVPAVLVIDDLLRNPEGVPAVRFNQLVTLQPHDSAHRSPRFGDTLENGRLI